MASLRHCLRRIALTSMCQDGVVDFGVIGAETAEYDVFGGIVRLLPFPDGGDCDGCRQVFGEAIDAGADAGEGDGVAVIVMGKLERVDVACLEQFGFIVVSAVPDGAGCMDDVFRRQVEARRDSGFSCVAAAEQSAGFQ